MNQESPEPHEPTSQPMKQGRRLIRMLFRSAADDSKSLNLENDTRAEDAGSVNKPAMQQKGTTNQSPVPTPISKFASLKRKLFPSQNRRHPLHVPPLVSPINAPVRFLLPPLGNNTSDLSCSSCSNGFDSDPIQENEFTAESIQRELIKVKQDEPHSFQDHFECNSYSTKIENSRTMTCRRTLMDEDDDLDLENALEALDIESSSEDKTLEEMSKAIDSLRLWKETHEQETQEALRRLKVEEDRTQFSSEARQDSTTCNETLDKQLELRHQKQQREREIQTLKLQKEAEKYQFECNLFRTKLNESEATQVEKALQSSSDPCNLALCRLRNELFELDVKQRQDALILELQGAEKEFDMNIVDVQAFTGELDAILAQFDSCELQSS